MFEALPWSITGFTVALLLVLWHYVAWRELYPRKKALAQLARQTKLSRDAVQKARNGPYEDSARQALEVSCSVYCKAAAEYNGLLKQPLYRVPAAMLGLKQAPAETESSDSDRQN